MGNNSSYTTLPQEATNTATNTESVTETPSIPVPQVAPVGTPSAPSVAAPVPTSIRRQPKYVHPFIEMLNKNSSESEMINTLQAFCGRIQVATDEKGTPIFEAVDQTEFIAPVLQVFSYCANNGKKSVVQWLITNFVPLQVSYDNNFCYFECLRWKHYDIADMLVAHESFNPSMEVLENLLERSKYQQFKKCMTSPYLRGDMQTYRFTFMYYVDNNQFGNIKNLLAKIKQRSSGQTIEIQDHIYPNPRLVQMQQTLSPLVAEPQASVPVAPVTPVAIVNETTTTPDEEMETIDVIVEQPAETSDQMEVDNNPDSDGSQNNGTEEITASQEETTNEMQTTNVLEETTSGLHQRTPYTMENEN